MLSLRRPRPRTVLVAALALLALAAAGTWLRSSSLVRVQDVTITGVDGRQARAIRAALTAAALDMTTLKVDEAELLRSVEGYPVVRSLRASADFPRRLRITVNAYEPVAALQRGATLTAAAADGTLLRGTSTKGLAIVAVRMLPGDGQVPDAGAMDAIRVLAAAPAPLRRRVARVFRGDRGLAATVKDGPKLYFGAGKRLRAKWSAAVAVLASERSQGASYVDLRIPERPVAGGFQPRQEQSQPLL
jgi:cell division protein FtsQ